MSTLDLLDSLLPFVWRGIHFACSSFDVDLSQDHAEHKFPDADGAHVEATGRNPLVFTARAMFRNNVTPGAAEKLGTPYPDQFRLFFLACADRTSGVLQHPEFGAKNVKCKSAKTAWNSTKRDGVDVDVVWVETVDPGHSSLALISESSPIAAGVAIAASLDSDIAGYSAANPPRIGEEPLITTSLSQLMQNISGLADRVDLFQAQVAGQVNQISYALDGLSDRLLIKKDPQTWPIVQSIEHFQSVLFDIKNKAAVGAGLIQHYVTPVPSTLASIAAFLGSPISEILQLNSQLITNATVPAGSDIRYYANLNDNSAKLTRG